MMASLHKPLSNQRWNLSPRVAGLHIGYEKSRALIVGRIQPEHPCSLASARPLYHLYRETLDELF